MRTELNIAGVLPALLNELIDGAAPEAAWVLNPRDPGMLKSLDKLTAEEASAISPAGGASIAAHVEHLCYGLQLLNRWSQGENPFAGADYTASWRRTKVSEEEWTSRRETLRREVYLWREAIKRPRDVSDFELTGTVASIVHLAYHLGAIRQMNRSIRGPLAQD